MIILHHELRYLVSALTVLEMLVLYGPEVLREASLPWEIIFGLELPSVKMSVGLRRIKYSTGILGNQGLGHRFRWP